MTSTFRTKDEDRIYYEGLKEGMRVSCEAFTKIPELTYDEKQHYGSHLRDYPIREFEKPFSTLDDGAKMNRVMFYYELDHREKNLKLAIVLPWIVYVLISVISRIV